jgi:hypothetical protein
MTTHHLPEHLDLQTAAGTVSLPADAVEALVAAGYLAVAHPVGPEPRFQLPDLKAFVARNSDNGSGGAIHRALNPDMEPEELVDLLDERAEHMAARLLKMYEIVFPQARSWSPERQAKFVLRTKERFEAILAIAALGEKFDPGLIHELEQIGAASARSNVKLPQILAMLRVSRDLVVQNAIDLAASGDRHGGHALSLLLTRILPAMDRLSDALTAGYWEAMFPA